MGLKPVPTEVRGGIIWVLGQPGGAMELDRHLAGLDEDLAHFGMAESHFFKQSIKRVPVCVGVGGGGAEAFPCGAVIINLRYVYMRF